MYSKVSKYSPEVRKRVMYHSSKGKSCGYYMRVVFFFSSLIQSLIIVSLVLFLIYGQQQDSASVDRVKSLELRFNELSIETVSLRQQRKNLTHLLNVTSMERARNEWDLARLRWVANNSYIFLEENHRKLQLCLNEKMTSSRMNTYSNPRPHVNLNPYGNGCNCGLQMETLKAKMQLVQSNFTQTAMQMQMEMDQMSRERDNLNLEAIQLRRDKSVHDKAIQFYQIKCKEDFVNSLSGISNVSKAFLLKIDSLFRNMPPFHLTCQNQKEYLEQIRTNCTDLSEEVVTKFQTYLDTLGNRVSMYQGNISILMAENMRMTRDYNLCSQNRTGLIREHKQHLEKLQLRNDDEMEKLLKDKIKLKGDIEVLESSIKLKNSELEHTHEQLKHLNLSCISRSGGPYTNFGFQPGSPWGQTPGSSNQGLPNPNSRPGNNNFGSSSSSSSSGSSFGSTGLNTGPGLSNSGFNKPSSTGLGSSSFGSSTANKPESTNRGSSSSAFGSTFGSSGTGLNKHTSTGLGSSSSSSHGSTFGLSNNPSSSSSSQNKFGSSAGTGTGSSNLGTNLRSSSSSPGSNYGSSSSNVGSNSGSSSNSGLGSSSSSKTMSNAKGSLNTFGSSSSSSGSSLGSSSSSQNKLSSSSSKDSSSSSSSSSSSGGSSATTSKSGGFGGWWGGLGGASSSSSSSKGSSTNSDQSKLGSNQGRGTFNSGSSFGSFGSGRTSSFTGPISVSQHLRDLERIINSPGPEEKQELSRMMG